MDDSAFKESFAICQDKISDCHAEQSLAEDKATVRIGLNVVNLELVS